MKSVEQAPFFFIALWLHWLILGLLCADALHARLLGVASTLETGVAFVCGVWLVVALSLYLYRPGRVLMHARYLLAFYTSLLSLTALGYALFLFYPGNTIYAPHINRISKAQELQIHGIQGISRFSTNQLGLRGPELPASKETYRVITVGGSTTVCTCLDDSKTWPHLLMKSTNTAAGRQALWVANAGMDGMNTANHLNFLTTIPALRVAQMLIFLIGANDLTAALAFEGHSSDLHMRYRAARIFSDSSTYPLYRRLKTYTVLNRAVSRLFSRVTSHDVRTCEQFDSLAERRARGPFISPPDLSISLEEYRHRIFQLASTCKATGQRCVFLTQPSIWKEGLSPGEEARLWFGWVGLVEAPKGYGRTLERAKAMLAYNNMLLFTCSSHGLECYDLASVVPRSQEYFSDDFHFTEAGARLVAEYLAAHMKFRK